MQEHQSTQFKMKIAFRGHCDHGPWFNTWLETFSIKSTRQAIKRNTSRLDFLTPTISKKFPIGCIIANVHHLHLGFPKRKIKSSKKTTRWVQKLRFPLVYIKDSYLPPHLVAKFSKVANKKQHFFIPTSNGGFFNFDPPTYFVSGLKEPQKKSTHLPREIHHDDEIHITHWAGLQLHYPCLRLCATIPPGCRSQVWKVAFEALGGEDDVLVLMVVGPQADALDTLPEPSSFKSWKFWRDKQTVVLLGGFVCVVWMCCKVGFEVFLVGELKKEQLAKIWKNW